MMTDEKLEFQHSISQFMLNKFRDKKTVTYIEHNGRKHKDKRPKIWTLDKQTGKCELKPIDETAGEGGLYDIVRPEGRDSRLERGFSEFESKASGVYRKVLKTGVLPEDIKEIDCFFTFLCHLHMRAPAAVKHMNDMDGLMRFVDDRESRVPENYREGVKRYLSDIGKYKGNLIAASFRPQLDRMAWNLSENFISALGFQSKAEFIVGDSYGIIMGKRETFFRSDSVITSAEYIIYPIASHATVLFINRNIEEAERRCRISVNEINARSARMAHRYIYGADKQVLEKAFEQSKSVEIFTL